MPRILGLHQPQTTKFNNVLTVSNTINEIQMTTSRINWRWCAFFRAARRMTRMFRCRINSSSSSLLDWSILRLIPRNRAAFLLYLSCSRARFHRSKMIHPKANRSRPEAKLPSNVRDCFSPELEEAGGGRHRPLVTSRGKATGQRKSGAWVTRKCLPTGRDFRSSPRPGSTGS
jgi:hypothetical protein